jgi:uncharacterized protein involved in type VI secretion and phage assembly
MQQRFVDGIALGVVLDNQDPDQKQRVRIRCPAISNTQHIWAKVVTPFVSKPEILMPEIGDEVVVAFEQGSIDSPYVLGLVERRSTIR